MDYHCPDCQKVVAKEDRRRKKGCQLVPRNGATLTLDSRVAPKVRCSCGKVIILLKGSLT